MASILAQYVLLIQVMVSPQGYLAVHWQAELSALALSLASLGAQVVIAPDYWYSTLKSFHIHNCDANCHQENLLALAGAIGYAGVADSYFGVVDGLAMLEEFELFGCEQLVLVSVVDLVSEHYLAHFLLVVDLVVVALFGSFMLLSVGSERCVAVGPGY